MNRKSQAAFEFLTTYVWAIFGVGITLGALYYFGILNFRDYIPQKCTFPSQFKCLDFSLTPTDVKFKLLNNLGEDVNVQSLSITNDAGIPLSCIAPPSFLWSAAQTHDFDFSSCSDSGYIPKARADLRISITYYAVNTPSQPRHLINGRINGKVLSS